MFRVRNIESNKWEIGEFYISHRGDLVQIKTTKPKFGKERVSIKLLSDNKYVWQEDIGYDDKNSNPIFEGDICKIETAEKTVVCVVAYVPSCAAYMLLDNKESKFYNFYNKTRNLIEIVGNVFEDHDLIEFEEDKEVEDEAVER